MYALFFALAAIHGLIILIADTTNAFQQSLPPTEQCYLQVDDAYCSWYKKHFHIDLNPTNHVVPLNKALQGHPEAGALWEHMIVGILEDEVGFRSTTHERNLYQGEINGKLLLVCHQVDDFAIATRDPRMADILIDKIKMHVSQPRIKESVQSIMESICYKLAATSSYHASHSLIK